MREIKNIVVHTTATSQNASIEAIKAYWKNNLKWKSVGYHIIVKANGEAVRLAPDSATTNGVAGHNSVSLHVSYIGGVTGNGKSIDNRTPAQKETLLRVLKEWKALYPNARILGHRDFQGVRKDCPCFDAIKEYKELF